MINILINLTEHCKIMFLSFSTHIMTTQTQAHTFQSDNFMAHE